MEGNLNEKMFLDRYQNHQSGRIGIIMQYNETDNTATVVISKQESNEVDDVLRNVQCPVVLGLIMVDPQPGRPCWVEFKDGNMTQPIITHFFNHAFFKYDYHRQYETQVEIPSYLLG